MSKKNFAAPYPPEQGGGQDSTAAAASTAQPGAVFAQDDAVSDAKEKKKKKINWKDRKTKKIIKRIIIWTVILRSACRCVFLVPEPSGKGSEYDDGSSLDRNCRTRQP